MIRKTLFKTIVMPVNFIVISPIAIGEKLSSSPIIAQSWRYIAKEKTKSQWIKEGRDIQGIRHQGLGMRNLIRYPGVVE
jgi:hypothetical protein